MHMDLDCMLSINKRDAKDATKDLPIKRTSTIAQLTGPPW
jgi:hypothetical protein